MVPSAQSVGQPPRLPARGLTMLPDNYGYRATIAMMAPCHLREHPAARVLRFLVIWQLRARGRNGPPSTRCPGHPLARHIDDFLTDLANANKPRNTIRAYRGDLVAFAAHHDGEVGGDHRRAGPGVPRRDRRAGPVDPQAQARRRRLVLQVGRPPRPAGRQPDGPHRHRRGPEDAAPPGGGRRRPGGARRDLLPATPQGRAPGRAAGPGAVRDRLRVRRPRRGGVRHVRRGPGPPPGRRARPRPRQGRHRPHRAARRPRLRRPAASSTSPGPGTPPARCSARRSTAGAGRCPTTPPTAGGRSTAPPPGSRSASTSCATPTPPS